MQSKVARLRPVDCRALPGMDPVARSRKREPAGRARNCLLLCGFRVAYLAKYNGQKKRSLGR